MTTCLLTIIPEGHAKGSAPTPPPATKADMILWGEPCSEQGTGTRNFSISPIISYWKTPQTPEVPSSSVTFIPTNQFLLASYFPTNSSQELWLFFHLSIFDSDISQLNHHIYSFMLCFTSVGSCLLSMIAIYFDHVLPFFFCSCQYDITHQLQLV